MGNNDDDDSNQQMIKELYDNGGSDDRRRPIISSEQFDVEAYASLYTGRMKIKRLLHIADRCGIESDAMELEALRIAYDEAKKGEDDCLFGEVAGRIDGRLGPNYAMDSAWIQAVQRRFLQRSEKLQNEMNVYKANLIKESMRMGYIDMGDFYYAHGRLAEALKCYVHGGHNGFTPEQTIEMCLNAILVTVEMGQASKITTHVAKAEETTEALDSLTIAKLHSAAGLAYLKAKNYWLAAYKFLEVGVELGNNYSEVIAPQDVGTYGGLCALATFDRSELKRHVIDNANFRNFLELVPEIRELIKHFYSSEYASCLNYLENLKANLLLDIHLHDHLETLYDGIRCKALIQYTLPYVSVDLNIMASVFKTNVISLQKELEALIAYNYIQARIDSHNKILYARRTNQRNTTFQHVIQTGNDFEVDVRSMLLRANVIKQ